MGLAKGFGSWVRQVMNAQTQYPEKWRVEFAEEAMSEMISAVMNRIESNLRIPTYDELLKNPRNRGPYKDLRESIEPGHTEKGERFEGIPEASLPITEELYYTTLWILTKGCRNPLAREPKTKLLDVLKSHHKFSPYFGGGAGSKHVPGSERRSIDSIPLP